MKLLAPAIGLFFVFAAGFSACGGELAASSQPQQGKSLFGQATDYEWLINSLRVHGASVEPQGEVDQPFLSVEGRMLKVHGEDVQVFQYPHAAAADAQAALVAPNGLSVGTSKVHWVGPPHFFKKGKLLVLYVGDNGKVLKALEIVLGRPFAGPSD